MTTQGLFSMHKISARNQLKGTVSRIQEGSVNNEITLALEHGETITTIITKDSTHALNLGIGGTAYAIFKAPWVVLAELDTNLQFSARNQYHGNITNIHQGVVTSTVHLRTDKGLDLTANITNESLQELNLKIGKTVLVLIKSSNIILATEK